MGFRAGVGEKPKGSLLKRSFDKRVRIILRWAELPIANRWRSANADNSCRPVRSSTWNQYYTSERQSRDWNRSTTNARSTRTKFCVFRGDMTANERQ